MIVPLYQLPTIMHLINIDPLFETFSLLRTYRYQEGVNSMKHNSLHMKKNGVINLIIDMLSPLKDFEEKLILRDGFFSLLLSRCVSIIVVLFSVYLLSFLSLFFGIHLVESSFKNIEGLTMEFWWSIPAVIGIPILIKLSVNFMNRNYIFSDRVINLLTTINYSTIEVSKFRYFLEFLFLVAFSLFYNFLLVLVLLNFLTEQFIDKLYEKPSFLMILSTISVTVYLTVRILAMEDNSDFNKYLKAKRSFYLWTLATLIIFVYLIGDLATLGDELSIKFPYAIITLMLAIEKTRDSYKKLTQSLSKLINNQELGD